MTKKDNKFSRGFREKYTANAEPAVNNPEQQTQKNEQQVSQDLQGQIAALQQEMADTKEKFLRALAEKENEQRRILREADDKRQYAIMQFAKDLTSCIDVLFLSTESLDEEALKDTRLKSFYDGMCMTRNEFMKICEKHGLHRVHPLKEQFDHNLHQVLATVEDGSASGTVVQVMKAGYRLHDRLLSPALVTVSAGPSKDRPMKNMKPGSNDKI